MGEATNITGVILEHGVTDEAFKDLIGKSMHDWLAEHAQSVKVVVRENYDHERVELALQLVCITLVPDGWNDSFDYRAIVRGGPEDRVGHYIEGQLKMTESGRKHLGYVRGS
jgi:anti-sigma factor ChrR (cupin superfamily)